MGENLTRKIIRSHLLAGEMTPGREIGLRIDQTLIQDATGTLVWLQFEKMGVPKVVNRVSVTYVDHNMLQTSFENADDHLFLQSMCGQYGVIFSRPGNGISHFAHLERFDVPGETMVGADSHTCTAGALAMLAIGQGGAEVAACMAGQPLYVPMPKVVRVHLTGELQPWVSPKDIILELLRRLSIKGGINKVMEYLGPGIEGLSVYQRATICNMTQELGATSGLFPADEQARLFLRRQGREQDYRELWPDPDAEYEETVEIDLSQLEPLIAQPHSPDNVVPVRKIAGLRVRQVAVGSSVNSGYTDLMTVARMLKGQRVSPELHMTFSPGSRQILINLEREGAMLDLALAGVRGLEVACGPCIGMGAAPPTGSPSIRTFNRNFPGRSGTPGDEVYLCSPETAAATAIRGVLTDPRDLDGSPPRIEEPGEYLQYTDGFLHPEDNPLKEAIYGPNIKAVPNVPVLPEELEGEVVLCLGDNISTDTILAGGAQVLPLRSNIPAIAEHTFELVDPEFPERARQAGGGFIVGGENWGQGSSREHAAAAPMYLGIKAILANSFARIHWSNLINWGILPLEFSNPRDFANVEQGDHLLIEEVRHRLATDQPLVVKNLTRKVDIPVKHGMNARRIEILLAGGLMNWVRTQPR